jgi:hypothetical protein
MRRDEMNSITLTRRLERYAGYILFRWCYFTYTPVLYPLETVVQTVASSFGVKFKILPQSRVLGSALFHFSFLLLSFLLLASVFVTVTLGVRLALFPLLILLLLSAVEV